MRKKVRDNTIVPTFGEAVREAIRRHPELSASEIADAAPRRETSGERIARLVDEVFSGRSPFTVGGVSGSTRAGLRLQMICQYCDGTDETCAWIGNYRHIFLCSSCGESGRHRSDCKVDRAAE
jgi:hypothetical protein